jgi:translocator protein
MDPLAFFGSIILAIAVVWPPILVDIGGTDQYKEGKKYIRIAPPSWLFPVVWTILYGLITAAGIIYILHTITALTLSTFTTALLATFFCNITFNHLWSVLFFKRRMILASFVCILVILCTAMGIVVLFSIEGEWICFWLYVPYVIWLAFATLLNALWLFKVPPTPPIPITNAFLNTNTFPIMYATDNKLQ